MRPILWLVRILVDPMGDSDGQPAGGFSRTLGAITSTSYFAGAEAIFRRAFKFQEQLW
jgi:hypothetical protein